MRYFTNCRTLEELKKEYKKLALKNHPDCGGSEETMKEINRQYDEAFEKVKNIHFNKEGQQYEKATTETPDEFRNIINALMRMQGVHAEVIGCFIWVSGNTKPYKDELKKLGFKWHSKKECWYKAPEGYKRYGKAQYSMEEIRDMYGVEWEGTGREESNLKKLA